MVDPPLSLRMRITKVFVGFNFRGTRPIREKREILHRAKISRYTVVRMRIVSDRAPHTHDACALA